MTKTTSTRAASTEEPCREELRSAIAELAEANKTASAARTAVKIATDSIAAAEVTLAAASKTV